LQEAIQDNLRRMKNFMGFAKGFIIRKNPVRTFAENFLAVLKNMFSITQKRKLARYRLSATMYKLQKYEETIAANNEHTFLRGNKLNEMR